MDLRLAVKLAASMKENVLPIASGSVDGIPVNIVPLVASLHQPPPAAEPACGRKFPAAARDYCVSVGSLTYQVSISTVNGTRLFRLACG